MHVGDVWGCVVLVNDVEGGQGPMMRDRRLQGAIMKECWCVGKCMKA